MSGGLLASSMDAVVFDESPMATYLQGQGNEEEVWHDSSSSPSTTSDQPSFAPRGLARLKPARPLPLKLPSPFEKGARRSRSAATQLTSHQSPVEDEQFLEQFRYTIVASQLLDDQISTVHHRRRSGRPKSQPTPSETQHISEAPTFSFRGATVSILVPFSLALIVKVFDVRSSRRDANIYLPWLTGIRVLLLTVIILAGVYAYSRWKFAKEIRHAIIHSLSGLVEASHASDIAITNALNFIQEVEIVSRGYDITSPLPPISRLEERTQQRRCTKLRRELASCLRELCHQYIEAHHALCPYAPEEVVEQYHDIYDVSRRDFQEVGLMSPRPVSEDPEALKSLKASFGKQFVSRKVVLCDLLAFSANHEDSDLKKWHVAIGEARSLSRSISQITSKITALLQVEQNPLPITAEEAPQSRQDTGLGITTSGRHTPEPETDANRAQMSRLSSLSQGIRTLSAKMHLFKEQVTEAIEERTTADVSAILAHQYDSAGADLKALLAEWERGKQLMMLQAHRTSNRVSRSSLSPTQSLGGSTAVGGSPLDAFKRLNGDEESDPSRTSPEQDAVSDEEIFEAIALPKQRSTLSREERLAKMREDRLKRALAQDKQDASTNMLRELETVIKHRPRAGTRTSVRNTTL